MHSSRPSTPSTALSTAPSEDDSDFCGIDPNDFFEQFRDDIDVSDELPSRETLAKAGDIPIFDAQGNVRPFKSIYSGDDVIGERQLVLFVRHFYCGVSLHPNLPTGNGPHARTETSLTSPRNRPAKPT